MNDKVFRQKSMEQISSTEELRDYMHVTSPRMWIILSAVLLLVVGFIIFPGSVKLGFFKKDFGISPPNGRRLAG